MESQETSVGHVFISYAREDQTYVLRLVDDLGKRGFKTWMDKRVESGARYVRSIEQAIRDSAAFVVVMTPKAEDSDFVEREILLAQSEDKPILPLLLRGKVFFLLINTQHDDVTNDQMPPDEFYERLEREVQAPTQEETTEVAPVAPELAKVREERAWDWQRLLPWLALAALLAIAVGGAAFWIRGAYLNPNRIPTTTLPAVSMRLTPMPTPSVTRTHTLTPTAPPTDTPVPPTNTPTPTALPPTPSGTATPTASPTVTATSIPGTPTPPPTATQPTPTPTATTSSPPTPTHTTTSPSSQFTPLNPHSLEEPTYGPTLFKWKWDGPLTETQGFEVRIWLDGEIPTGVYDAAQEWDRVQLGDDNTYQLIADITKVNGNDRPRGDYYWTVLLVEIKPAYKELGGIQAPFGRLRFVPGGNGGGDDRSGTGGIPNQ